ncbi:hypothetical protein [Streptomyces sp. GMY02]|nr:hypothetical protein [Streptomyces sp. GMY02]QXE37106.1 hypothetical protein KQY30_25695 [Streptomyces sp. GMY02]
MRLFEEIAEHRRLARELAELLDETNEPDGLTELGWDSESDCFRGRRVA